MIDYLNDRFGTGVAVFTMFLTVVLVIGFIVFVLGPPIVWAVRLAGPLELWWLHLWGVG